MLLSLRLLSQLVPAALPSLALAETLPLCPVPSLYVAKDVLGIEGDFSDIAVTLRADQDAGGSEVAVDVQRSNDTVCNGGRSGFRIVPREPLIVGARYVLETRPSWYACLQLNTEAKNDLSFIAVAAVAFPAELPPAPAPELKVSGCAEGRDYHYFEAERPDVATMGSVRLRLGVDDWLDYCRTHTMLAEPCKSGEEHVRTLRWVADVPHTGVRLEGPTRQVTFRCDDAQRTELCPESVTPSDAGTAREAGAAPDGAMSEARTAGSSAGCELAQGDVCDPGIMGVLLVALVGSRSIRRRRAPLQS